MNPVRTREAIFETTVAEVYEPLQRFVRRRADADVVDDVVADTLLVLWRRFEEIPAGKTLPWTYGVARRCLANARRSRVRHLRLVDRLQSEPQTDTDVAEGDPELEAALSALPAAAQELLRLWAWEGLEAAEIAVVFGITSNAAAIRLHRAKADLKKIMEARKNSAPSGHSHRVQTKEERP